MTSIAYMRVLFLLVFLPITTFFGSGCGSCERAEEPGKSEQPEAAAIQTVTDAEAAAASATPTPGVAGTLDVNCFVIVDTEPDFGSPPLTVQFMTEVDCSSGPVTFGWDFGDGASGGNEPGPSHVYEKPGDYIVTVTVEAPDGGHGKDEIDVTVDAFFDE